MSTQPSLTELLSTLGQGDTSVLNQITPIILDELHRQARRYMQQENPGHTLQATALVNEAYLKLIDMDVDWKSRLHFYSVAARLMRRILVDHARQKNSAKRGVHYQRVDLDQVAELNSDHTTELIDIDNLLNQLEQFDRRACRMFELRLFSGLTNAEIAAVENLSIATVEREIRTARAWIKNEMVNP